MCTIYTYPDKGVVSNRGVDVRVRGVRRQPSQLALAVSVRQEKEASAFVRKIKNQSSIRAV